MQYRIVQNIEGAFLTATTDDLLAWAEVRGIKVAGACHRRGIRAELQGQPVLEGFCGPMWDGDAIRYEDRRAYDILST